jgi:thiamine biosynthesis lipoprotein
MLVLQDLKRYALCSMRYAWCSIHRIELYVIAALISLLLFPDCSFARREHRISGRTMGTTYQVKVITGRYENLEGLAERIQARLAEINRSMSTYIEDSEISRFNRFDEVNRPFPVSEDFLRVMQAGKKIHALSEGAWDATVAPLVDLWGFGPSGKTPAVPSAAQLQPILETVGFERIDVHPSGYLVKKVRGTTLDLGSIAKGYGVDQLANLLVSAGRQNFLVEIGGEVVATGVRTDGLPWRVGINTPRPGASADTVYRAFSLSNAAFATSGDYRNFFIMDGRRYSHVIDPRTGYPVANGVVSASIIASECTFADGLATAVMVLGAEKGLALIDRLEGVEGLIVVAAPGGDLTDYFSKGLENHR